MPEYFSGVLLAGLLVEDKSFLGWGLDGKFVDGNLVDEDFLWSLSF